MIARMDRIEVVFLRSELTDMVGFLQDQGVVHIEEVPLALENHPGYLHRVHLPEQDRAELAALGELEQMLKESLPLLSVQPTHLQISEVGPEVEDWSLEVQRKNIRQWHRTLRSLNRRRLNVQDNIAVLENYSAVLRALGPLLSSKQAQLGRNARAFILEGYTEEGLSALEARFTEVVGAGLQFSRASMGRNRTVLVVIHPEAKAAEVEQVVRAEEIVAVESPDKEVTGESVPQVLNKLNQKVQSLRASLDQILSELQVYTEQNNARMVALAQVVENRIRQLHVVDNFAQSRMVCVAHGYIPHADYAKFRSALKTRFGSRAALGKLPLSDVDLHEVPSKRELPAWAQPFELIMNMMKPPSYGGFDPTALVAFSFIFFYGFILGDAAYGALMILIGMLVKKKWGHIRMLRDGMTIFQFMGASAIAWGVIYGEYLGNFVEKIALSINPNAHIYIFHRAHETETLLNIAILIGAIHVPLALILGIREGYAHGHTKHAEERLAMLIGLGALVTALVASAGYFPLGAGLGLALAALLFGVALVFFVKSMGAMAPMGVIEIIGLSANILSYARLMALGIASIAFADIANAMPVGAGSIVALVSALLGAMLVHLLNIGIGVFSPTIHSLRLNLVEFLPKFYEPHGRMYEPFRKDMAW